MFVTVNCQVYVFNCIFYDLVRGFHVRGKYYLQEINVLEFCSEIINYFDLKPEQLTVFVMVNC